VEAVTAARVVRGFLYKQPSWRQDVSVCDAAEIEAASARRLRSLRRLSGGEQSCNFHYLVTPENLTSTISFPNCRAGRGAPIVEEMDGLNDALLWKMVTFPSRKSDDGAKFLENLEGWWLPAQKADAPRIVLVHDSDTNFNHWTVHTVAYLLRSMGFGVLIPSLRDHGSSPRSDHPDTVGWGWDYHLDVLGAWDLAVRDNGELGGAVPGSKVGILGLGFGGFVALNAFGMEQNIPAVWLDSAPLDPRRVLHSHIVQQLEGDLTYIASKFASAKKWVVEKIKKGNKTFPVHVESIATTSANLAPWFTEVAWRWAKHKSPVSLDAVTPVKVLQPPEKGEDAPPRRIVAVVHGEKDTVVPSSESRGLIVAVELNGYVTVNVTYRPQSICGDDTHVVSHMWGPNAYREKLCEFWSDVFPHAVDCNALDVPDLETVALDVTETTTTAKATTRTETMTSTATATATETTATSTTKTTTFSHPLVRKGSPLWNLLHSTTTTATVTRSPAAGTEDKEEAADDGAAKEADAGAKHEEPAADSAAEEADAGATTEKTAARGNPEEAEAAAAKEGTAEDGAATEKTAADGIAEEAEGAAAKEGTSEDASAAAERTAADGTAEASDTGAAKDGIVKTAGAGAARESTAEEADAGAATEKSAAEGATEDVDAGAATEKTAADGLAQEADARAPMEKTAAHGTSEEADAGTAADKTAADGTAEKDGTAKGAEVGAAEGATVKDANTVATKDAAAEEVDAGAATEKAAADGTAEEAEVVVNEGASEEAADATASEVKVAVARV